MAAAKVATGAAGTREGAGEFGGLLIMGAGTEAAGTVEEIELVRRTLPDAAAAVSAVAAAAGGCAACFLSSGSIFLLSSMQKSSWSEHITVEKYRVGWLQYDVGKIWEACRRRNES